MDAIRRRLVRNGVLAAMRRALAACPDAGRERALPLSSLNHSSPAELLALRLRIEQANAERGSEPDAYVFGRRGGGVVKRPHVPRDRPPSRIRRR